MGGSSSSSSTGHHVMMVTMVGHVVVNRRCGCGLRQAQVVVHVVVEVELGGRHDMELLLEELAGDWRVVASLEGGTPELYISGFPYRGERERGVRVVISCNRG